MIEREQIDYLLTAAYNAAIKAGAKIDEIYNGYDDFFVSLKSDSTPITIADSEAHAIIRKELNSTRIPLQSEEGRDILYEERRGWDLYWLVDPLDGTEEFIKRNGEFTVNIALMVNNSPKFGIIYLPTSHTIYFSDPDRGSFCKTGVKPDPDSKITINQIFDAAVKLPLRKEPNSPYVVAVSRSNESSFVREYLDQLKEKVGDIKIIEYGSSLKFCLVAEGSADYHIRTTVTKEWDIAAGHAIIKGAGATIQTFDNHEIRYNEETLENGAFSCQTQYAPPFI